MQSDECKCTEIPAKGTAFVTDMLQEPTVQNVTLYGTESFASGIPLFALERDQPTFHAICITKSTVLQYVSLALATCRTLGYDALQRYDTHSGTII
jgi:hypothetical protein